MELSANAAEFTLPQHATTPPAPAPTPAAEPTPSTAESAQTPKVSEPLESIPAKAQPTPARSLPNGAAAHVPDDVSESGVGAAEVSEAPKAAAGAVGKNGAVARMIASLEGAKMQDKPNGVPNGVFGGSTGKPLANGATKTVKTDEKAPALQPMANGQAK